MPVFKFGAEPDKKVGAVVTLKPHARAPEQPGGAEQQYRIVELQPAAGTARLVVHNPGGAGDGDEVLNAIAPSAANPNPNRAAFAVGALLTHASYTRVDSPAFVLHSTGSCASPNPSTARARTSPSTLAGRRTDARNRARQPAASPTGAARVRVGGLGWSPWRAWRLAARLRGGDVSRASEVGAETCERSPSPDTTRLC